MATPYIQILSGGTLSWSNTSGTTTRLYANAGTTLQGVRNYDSWNKRYYYTFGDVSSYSGGTHYVSNGYTKYYGGLHILEPTTQGGAISHSRVFCSAIGTQSAAVVLDLGFTSASPNSSGVYNTTVTAYLANVGNAAALNPTATASLSFKLIWVGTLTIDNTDGQTMLNVTVSDPNGIVSGTYEVAAGASSNVAYASGATIAVSTTPTTATKYLQQFNLNDVSIGGGAASATPGQASGSSVLSDCTLKPIWVDKRAITIDNTNGYAACTATNTDTPSIAVGERKTIYLYPSSTTISVAAIETTAEHFLYWERNGAQHSTAQAFTITPESGDTFTPIWTPKYTIRIQSPSQAAITYQIGLNGVSLASGTVAAGSYKDLSVYNGTNGKMSISLSIPESAFSYDTFKGWTRDGTVFDRYSNPALATTDQAVTFSCTIGTATTDPDSSAKGKLLIDGYGNLIFSDSKSVSHTVRVKATWHNTDKNHAMVWQIGNLSGSASGYSIDSGTKTISSNILTGDGKSLLYADKIVSAKPNLCKVTAHCGDYEDLYDIQVWIDGVSVFSETYLSALFSRTLDLNNPS